MGATDGPCDTEERSGFFEERDKRSGRTLLSIGSMAVFRRLEMRLNVGSQEYLKRLKSQRKVGSTLPLPRYSLRNQTPPKLLAEESLQTTQSINKSVLSRRWVHWPQVCTTAYAQRRYSPLPIRWKIANESLSAREFISSSSSICRTLRELCGSVFP